MRDALVRFAWCLSGFLCSCDSSRVFEDFRSIDGAWTEDEVKSFEFEVADTTVTYQLKAQFQHAHTFPYSNFYFDYRLKNASDSVISEGMKEIIFFDPKTGEPLGSGVGNSYTRGIVLEKNYKFDAKGHYKADFRQFMRLDSLPDIRRIGFRVEKEN